MFTEVSQKAYLTPGVTPCYNLERKGDLNMPTEKKRVNLTIPDALYERISVYKKKNGISSDAGACLQLITRELDNLEQGELMLQAASKFSLEELQQLSNLGLAMFKDTADKAGEQL